MGSTIWQLWNLTGLVGVLNCSSPLVKMELKCHFSHWLNHPASLFRLCWFCPVYQPSLLLSPSWWFFPSSYTTAAVTAVIGVRDQRRRRRMKMAAQVTVTVGRKGGASAVSRGWRWRLSLCAGEMVLSDALITKDCFSSHFLEVVEKVFNIYIRKNTPCLHQGSP